MDWTHPKAGYWRAEQPIPVGVIIAKAVSRRYLKEHGHYEPADDPQGYRARVELALTDALCWPAGRQCQPRSL